MPRLRITGRGNELVWEGEGELVLERTPLSPPEQPSVRVRQTEYRPTERRGRELDLTVFLREVPHSYSIQCMTPSPAWDLHPDPVVDVRIPLPSTGWVLHVDYPAGSLTWLARILDQPFETAEERTARHEEFERRMRAAGEGSLIRGLIQQSMYPGMVRAAAAMEDLRNRIAAASEPGEALAAYLRETGGGHGVQVAGYEQTAPDSIWQARYASAPRLTQEEIDQIYRDMMRPPADVRAMLDMEQPMTRDEARRTLDDSRDLICQAFGVDPSEIGAAGDLGQVFPEVLERIRARQAEHDAVIDSTLEAFPYDPLQYGRRYPGDQGTSHWSPPDDPDEKIRSHP